MLSGFLSSSKGNAWINGYDVKNNMNAIRKYIGICPQHDILWDRLTAAEHLHFFAKLKGVPASQLSFEVNRVINLFNMLDSGLWGKYPTTMSGGEKRRLSLAIALIGGSPVVFLDEPTSGMDPENRRKVWDIIQQEKRNRCIILTTHYMDEADVLGDRIAIMADGEIKCCGSSLYLKQLYGFGYTFTVSLNQADNDNQIKPQIDEILNGIDGVKTVSMAASELIYRLPFQSSSQFSQIFSSLDVNKEALDIKTFGISVTTLEEVFIKIGSDNEVASDSMMQLEAGGDEEKSAINSSNNGSNIDAALEFQDNIEDFKLEHRNLCVIYLIHTYAILYKRFWWSLRDIKGIICQIILPVVLCGLLFGMSLPVDIYQDSLTLTADQWTPEYTDSLIVPIGKLADGVDYNLANISSGNLYYMESGWPSFYSRYLQDTYGANISYPIDNATTAGPNCYSDCSAYFQRQLYDGNGQNPDRIPYNAFYFDPYEDAVLFGVNASAYHSLPITLNEWDNWVLQKEFDDAAKITTNTHPFPLTTAEQSQQTAVLGIFSAILLMVAFSLIPASSIYFVVNEKSIGTKHQQFVSGISVVSYWCGTFLSDILFAIPTVCLIIAAVYIFDFEALQNNATVPFLLTFIGFIASSTAGGYLLHFLFTSPGKSQMVTIILNILLGAIMVTLTFFFDQLPQLQDTSKDLKIAFRFFPIYTLGSNILHIFTTPPDSALKKYYRGDVDDNLYCMLAEAIGYFALVLVIEFAMLHPSVLAKLGFVVDQPRRFQKLDDDVVAEQHRIRTAVANGNYNDDTVLIAGLRKVYKGENKFSPFKPAVRDLYYGVKQGEIFGFLGTNGAGKSSTLKLLTGEIFPSDGNAFIQGLSIDNQASIRRMTGFCPQNDAIFDLLTAREHLRFYALIKGLWNRTQLESQIEVLLKALTLKKYAKRQAGTYSGGNKRKLCVAQAMIGNPPVVFLDEPSTGMDPVSRRQMWKFINQTMAGRAVILTTHSMEECEALCHRVGIMVDGQLSCIGSPQHLKSKFGKGYQLDVTFKQDAFGATTNDDDEKKETEVINVVNVLDDRIHKFLEELNEIFPASIIERNGAKVLLEIRQYQVMQQQAESGSLSSLSRMFEMVENLKEKYNILSYALSQTSLEQIFLKMAKAGGEVEEKADENVNDQQKNLLKQIENETKEDLLKRLGVLNRDHLQQILQLEIKNGNGYILRALDIKSGELEAAPPNPNPALPPMQSTAL